MLHVFVGTRVYINVCVLVQRPEVSQVWCSDLRPQHRRGRAWRIRSSVPTSSTWWVKANMRYVRLCQKQSCPQPSINQSINWSIKMRVREGGRIAFCPAGDHNNNLMHERQILLCWAVRIILFLRPCFILAPFPFIKVLIDAIANKHASVSDALKPGVRNRRSVWEGLENGTTAKQPCSYLKFLIWLSAPQSRPFFWMSHFSSPDDCI